MQTIFLPVIGLVDPDKLKPGDLVGVNKDSYLILDTLPSEYDSRVKAMEVDEKPTEDYNDIGGLEKQVICFLQLMDCRETLWLSLYIPSSNMMFCGNTDSRACGSNSVANDTQGPISEVGYSSPQRCSFVWTAWDREDTHGSCVCCTD
jgi:hypothetical protein